MGALVLEALNLGEPAESLAFDWGADGGRAAKTKDDAPACIPIKKALRIMNELLPIEPLLIATHLYRILSEKDTKTDQP